MKTRKFFAIALSFAALAACNKPAGGSDDPTPDPGPSPEPPYVDGTTVIDGRNALDLGTGILWADVNIGSEKPEDYGDYFAWGEISPKEKYNWAGYKWGDGFEPETTQDYDMLKMTKYCMFKAYGNKDDKSVLEAEDDAASQIWKNGWRMPTKEEVDALMKECTWEWTRVEGLYGYELTSKKTKKSIFLPANGMIAKDGSHNMGFICSYWTSSLFKQNEQYYAYSYMYNEEGNPDRKYQSNTFRYLGMGIRPVHDKK